MHSTEKLTPVFYPTRRLAYVATALELRAQRAAGLLEITRVQSGWRKPDKDGNIRPKMKVVHAILHDGPIRLKAGTKYHHNHFVPEFFTDDQGRNHKRNELDANPQGVFTLKRIDPRDREIFLTPLLECAGLIPTGAERRNAVTAPMARRARSRHYSPKHKAKHSTRPAYSDSEAV